MKQINFIYTTRRGTFFHLSPTNQNNLNLDNVLISVGDFAHMERVL
jgi:queuine tRNA-ribosyltransferase subunit QTRTD1